MKLYDLIISRRTIRAFQKKAVSRELLERFVNAGRLAPQAANRQPLEFIIVDDNKMCGDIFPLITLGGYIDWKPTVNEQPAAYIAVLANPKLQKEIWIPYDIALASENICLSAWEEGIGSCLIGSFHKNEARDILKVPEDFQLPLLIALGYPLHKSTAVDMEKDDVRYWRNEKGDFTVPKRPFSKIVHYNGF